MTSPRAHETAVREFFRDLRADTFHLVDTFYAEDALFRDPVGEQRGREALREYYGSLYRDVRDIRFDFEDFLQEEDRVVAIWVMHLQAPKLNGGRPMSLPGASHFRFNPDGQAVYHRDYFDMGAFIYEQVPVLKQIVRFVKSRLEP